MGGNGNGEHNRPQAEDDLHFAEEVQALCEHARRRRQSGSCRFTIVCVLNAMRQRTEPGCRKGMEHGQREDAGRYEVKGLQVSALRQGLPE